MLTKKEIGWLIKRTRESAGMTLQQAASAADLSFDEILAIEAGKDRQYDDKVRFLFKAVQAFVETSSRRATPAG